MWSKIKSSTGGHSVVQAVMCKARYKNTSCSVGGRAGSWAFYSVSKMAREALLFRNGLKFVFDLLLNNFKMGSPDFIQSKASILLRAQKHGDIEQV